MKLLALPCLLLLGTFAHASNDVEADQMCMPESKKAVAERFKVPTKKVKFFNGAGLGDGAGSIQINFFTIKGIDGFIKIELDADGCMFRNIEQILG